MRTIIIKVEIDDNDEAEQALFWKQDKLLGLSMKDFIKLPDTKELYDTDTTFRKICKAVKVAIQAQKDYIHKYNSKTKTK